MNLYRPYISEAEIQLLIQLLKPSHSATSLYKRLVELSLKISHGLTSPALVRKEGPVKNSKLASLGFDSEGVESMNSMNSENTLESTYPLKESDAEQYNSFAVLAISGDITDAQREEGKSLELKLYGFNSGIFDSAEEQFIL